jgi:hypothetical protein
MGGVATIPLEARIQSRVGVSNDLSPLAHVVARAKLESAEASAVWDSLDGLRQRLRRPSAPNLADADFGLNGPIKDYFHPTTLSQLLGARAYFAERSANDELTSADAVVLTATLHILHGNRPYALSRRSHPVTPFAPSGEFVAKDLVEKLEERLQRVLPVLADLSGQAQGLALRGDFRDVPLARGTVDAIITSPPFTKSLRFWSSNWMRLWFAGWDPQDFHSEPKRYLETEQRHSFDPYREFATTSAHLLKPGGRLILHLGETATSNMAAEIAPLLLPHFTIEHVGAECVRDTESHGLRDKGATLNHWYLFATKC